MNMAALRNIITENQFIEEANSKENYYYCKTNIITQIKIQLNVQLIYDY